MRGSGRGSGRGEEEVGEGRVCELLGLWFRLLYAARVPPPPFWLALPKPHSQGTVHKRTSTGMESALFSYLFLYLMNSRLKQQYMCGVHLKRTMFYKDINSEITA